MHWTAQLSRAGRINAAVNPAVDPISGQPELKHTPVEIRRLAVQWHGTILARRPIMLPEITYWARIRGAGYHAYLLAGEQPLAIARRALSAAMRTANPGPWLDGEDGLGAVISDGRLEAVLSIGEAHDEAARDRLAPFMALAPARRRAATRPAAGRRCGRPRRRDLRLLRRVLRRGADGDRRWRDDARCRRRRHQGRHQLRLLPARDPRPAARGAAAPSSMKAA